MIIRRTNEGDIPAIHAILRQVNDIHAALRPDLFHTGETKYTAEELRAILADAARPVFVAELSGQVVGYAFCVEKREHTPTLYLGRSVCGRGMAQARRCGGALRPRHGICKAEGLLQRDAQRLGGQRERAGVL